MSKKGQLPAFLGPASAKKRINARSAKQEKDRAKEIGGKAQVGSGSSWRAPEDVRGPIDEDGEGFLEQLKQYATGKFTISASEWQRLRKNARITGREPRLIIEFPNENITLVIVEKDA